MGGVEVDSLFEQRSTHSEFGEHCGAVLNHCGPTQDRAAGEGREGFRCREQLGAEIYISLQVIPAERRPDKDYSSVEEESRAQREKSERP